MVSKGFSYTLYPDVVPCLRYLEAKDRRIGVVSNCPSEDFLKDNLSTVGILDFFQCIVSSGTEGVAKPDPEIFHIASARIGLNESALLFVGDAIDPDIRGAEKAGLRAILIDREERNPQYVGTRISSLHQLMAHI